MTDENCSSVLWVIRDGGYVEVLLSRRRNKYSLPLSLCGKAGYVVADRLSEAAKLIPSPCKNALDAWYKLARVPTLSIT
jgi:hypothetical protein